MSRILVTGASGLLGLNFCMQFAHRHTVTGVVNNHPLPSASFPIIQADLTAPGEVERVLAAAQPEIILHCAALANLEACENRPELAQQVNALLPGELAHAAARTKARLVHLSTDAVFDGVRGNYSETDDPNPLGVYARTKREGELNVMAANRDAIVARVNFYGWSLSRSRSLAEFFFYNLRDGNPVRGFTDVFFCPLVVDDLADILLEMVELRLSGLYHVVSSQALSKYDFGCAIARRFGLNASLIAPSSWTEGGLKAARSPNLMLSTAKLVRELGRSLPDQEEGLRRFHQSYLSGLPDAIASLGVAA
ncbi:MAG: SDR family oxidoreductase [Anaerolineae bacterium]|nr:SDR family oxidoreductase [Anaerolineae bacterium]